jgi:hypothetical protein
LFETLSVIVAEVDFHDPALRDEPNARERGVRVEIRPTTSATRGTMYVSATITVHPAICRVDLLESRPGASDRMHWHPGMRAGEPGERRFDAAMSADPIRWLTGELRNFERLLEGTEAESADRHRVDAPAVSGVADEIVDAVRAGLESCRKPWPQVERDERGMAISAP